jgi:hypothetical protein
MGEAKRRHELVDAVTRRLIDEGKLIEAGWLSLRRQAIAPNASQAQLDEMRMAFFAGAQHLWGSVMTALEPGEIETEVDMRRMEAINAELEAFVEQLKLRIEKTEGRA